MKKTVTFVFLLTFALTLGFAFVLAPSPTFAQAERDKEVRKEEPEDDDDDENLSDADRRQVKVPIESAREIALNRVPGKIVDEELEKERGRLQYAFDIKAADGKIFDVEVNAITGEVLQAEEEDDDDVDDGEDTKRSRAVKKRQEAKTAKLVRSKPH